jgi:Heparan-alpha-glucosaminide N-acetyltransferase, catalytic
MILGGMGAPLFLFLAGLSVSMSAGSKLRRMGDAAAASRAVTRRGLEIFGLAFLFRLQAWILGWAHPRTLLKVDILNIMGPSIMMAATLWRVASTLRGRVTAFALATLAVAFFTPALRGASFFAVLPDPIEAYFRPVGGLSNFVFLPWAAFVFAGAIPGVLIDATRTAEREARVGRWFGVAGALIATTAFVASYLPSPFPNAYFWDYIARVLLPAGGVDDSNHLCGFCVGIESWWSDEVESDAPARSHVVVRLLDSRRDGLRAHLASAAQIAGVRSGARRAHSDQRLHADLLDCQGSCRNGLSQPRHQPVELFGLTHGREPFVTFEARAVSEAGIDRVAERDEHRALVA